MLDVEPAFLDVDVGRAVFAHRAELHQMDGRVDLGDRVEQIEGADHVVVLGIGGVPAVDHRIRRGPLLGEVDDRLRREFANRTGQESGVQEIAFVTSDPLARDLFPGFDPDPQVFDRDQAFDTEFDVVPTAGEVVEDGHFMASVGQVQRRRPAEVSVAAENEHSHGAAFPFRLPAEHAAGPGGHDDREPRR